MSFRRTHPWFHLTSAIALVGCAAGRSGADSTLLSRGDNGAHFVSPQDAASGVVTIDERGDADPRRDDDRAALGAPLPRDLGEGILEIDAPSVLAELEAGGASLGAMLGATSLAKDNRALANAPRYDAMARTLEADLAQIARSDPNAGVSVARFSHRLFDAGWLRSPAARFELIGVVNRLDRAGIVGGCGEVRLVYRLAYATEQKGRSLTSRLPMTVSVELSTLTDVPAPSPDRSRVVTENGGASPEFSCRDAAHRWFPRRKESTPTELAAWLLSERGPLAPAQRAPRQIRRVAVNLQSVRWPSTVRPDLGGHAEYLLRTFRDDGREGLVAAPLENTLDTARVRRGTPEFAKLLSWLGKPEHLAAIDGATSILPDELSATRAVSVTPRGWSRLKNRPFSSVLRTTDVQRLPLAELRFAKSPAALLRRLDDLTCSGCHESRSVAGFHFLGVDREEGAASNRLAVAFSPHFAREQDRRRDVLRALRDGKTPSFARPLAERAARGDGGYGAHCGLGDPGFVDWTCDAGLRCERYDAPRGDDTVGICLPEGGGRAGDPCESGPVSANVNPLLDRIARRATSSACSGGAVCNTNAVGFPGGMCTPSCGDLPREAACGRIAILDAFNACLAANKNFEGCIAEHSSPAGLRRCSSDEPCRDDYICAGGGVCIPPYFVFQMRVDGHPLAPR